MSTPQVHVPPSMSGTGGYPKKGNAESLKRSKELAASVRARKVVQSFIIPATTGKGFKVAKGEIFRITCNEGPQVADMMVFNSDDYDECFWQSRTRVIYGGHLKAGDELWSVPPKSRAMLTMISDTLEYPPLEGGALPHDLLYCRCDARLYELVHKRTGKNPNCNDNLADAIAPFGLKPTDVHDPFNVFMTTGLNAEGRPFYLPSVSKKGDYVEFHAEMNALIAISACPGGSSGPKSYPLQIDVYGKDVA